MNFAVIGLGNFVSNIENKKECSPSANDALEVMRMISFVYKDK